MWRLPPAIRRLKAFGKQNETLFQRYDWLRDSVLTAPSCRLGDLALALDKDSAIERLRQYTPFTPNNNISGTTAISLPLASSQDGLPIGVQFAAAMGQERRLLDIAY